MIIVDTMNILLLVVHDGEHPYVHGHLLQVLAEGDTDILRCHYTMTH
jgi:hypothetical protein